MKQSGIILVTIALIVTMASLAPTVYAVCKTCGVEEDWSASANNFLEGKPINDTPSSLSNPQQTRLRNADFNSNLLKENTGNASNSPAQALTLNCSATNTRY